jgi:hypothetical protein
MVDAVEEDGKPQAAKIEVRQYLSGFADLMIF